ncbi:SNARE-like domain protein [Leptospira fainei serovar Hurstbridge str. BUT 6]|uniref:SNARE-like domain protein n=1 Tax=Leptospira fainei serovar Hurstbridge str. BUT 6 TaxID=1193011 RepID=S3W7H4_9LEPT|nr:DedA family protein [Leptospira fainei]EPG76032.1 SNARE-like domain protein [Leptospira fainei serovar Hurstbridge str. BUT 6]
MAGFESTLEYLLDWVANLPPILVWLFFAASNLTENVFPPWPGDTVTAFGGFLLARGKIGFWSLITSTLVGNLLGAWLMYSFGHHVLAWLKHRNFPFKAELYDEEAIEKTLNWFSRNSVIVVIFSRFSAGIRFFVSIVAGMVEMHPILFFSCFSLSVLIWCGILIYAGHYLGSHWEVVIEFLAVYNEIISIILVSAGIGFLIYRHKNRSKKTKAP